MLLHPTWLQPWLGVGRHAVIPRMARSLFDLALSGVLSDSTWLKAVAGVGAAYCIYW
jgi:hypothetical protein